jgi:hypothetical protein
MTKITRFYTTKINDLIWRKKIYNHGYPYEFLNKMTSDEIDKYLNELKKQVRQANITPHNINRYNNVIKTLIQEREDIYQNFKQYESL